MSTFNRYFTYDFEGTEVDLDASTGDSYTWLPERPMIVLGATVHYSEATDAAIATPGVVSLDHTPSGGSRTEKGTYTAEVSKAIGTEENMSITQFKVRDGDTVILEHKTQQTSMEAGKVKLILHCLSVPDATN